MERNKQGDCYAIPKILATSESIEAVVIDDVGAGPPVERVVDVGEQDVEEEARNSNPRYFAPQAGWDLGSQCLHCVLPRGKN